MSNMQTLANSMQDSGAWQRLQRNLEAVPRLLFGEQRRADQDLEGRVSGEHNFHFTFRLEGGGSFQTGVLVARGQRSPGGLELPLRCTWKRRVRDVLVEIPGIHSCSYQISADDVGTEIVVEAMPTELDSGCHGLAMGALGPFELDPSTRRVLDNALGLGEAHFEVGFRDAELGRERMRRKSAAQKPTPPTTPRAEQVTVHVTPNDLKVSNIPDPDGRGVANVVAEHTPDYPRVILHQDDNLTFTLVMKRSPHEDARLTLAAGSRAERDLVTLTIRCFHAKKHISEKQVLLDIMPVHLTHMMLGSEQQSSELLARFDISVVLERLLKELNRVMIRKEAVDRTIRNTRLERQDLEEQLGDTVEGFAEAMTELERQLDDPAEAQRRRNTSPERVEEQVREAHSTNKSLQAELWRAGEELARLRTEREARRRDDRPSGGGALIEEAQRLKEERSGLQTKLMQLSRMVDTARQQDSQDEQTRTLELRRLRQDVEAEHQKKEQLRRDLQVKNREKEDLQQNFLYVKQQLDNIHMKQATTGPSDGTREAQKHQRALDEIGDEKCRLSSRMETLLNELEKEKGYHEQSMDRLMKVNGKLMEEKDREVREVQRLGQLYADSVKQLEEMSRNCDTERTTGSLRPASTDSSPEDEVLRLRAQLEVVDSGLQKRQSENESLKLRIRKLATA